MGLDVFHRTHATLLRGADMFARACASRPDRSLLAGTEPLRCRVIGNGLRELDRFLNLLIDAAVVVGGGTADPRLHNTANKFALLHPGQTGDLARLRALGRSRTCLFYGAGLVSRGDRAGGTELTIGWWDDGSAQAPKRLRRVRVGDRVDLCEEDLLEVSAFYTRLANQLAGAAGLAGTGSAESGVRMRYAHS